MILSRYCKVFLSPENNGLLTLFSTRTLAVADVEPGVLLDVERGSLPAEDRDALSAEGFLVEDHRGETREMLGFIDGLNAENDTFTAIVALNLDCNLGCSYCFEGKRKGGHYFSAETADRFVDFVKGRDLAGKDEIHLIFYGGEPLLSRDMILRVSEKLNAFAKRNKTAYSFSFITNGTLLTPRVVEQLKPLGLEGASVTLDGPREVHDTFRPFKSGKGSFDTILGNLREVCTLTDIQIGGNFTRERYREFPRLLDHLLEEGLTPEKISSVRFDPVVRETGEYAPPDFHGGCASIGEPWLAEASVFLREEILKRGFRAQEILPVVCMMEHRDSVVVNYDGTLYKCPGLIGREEFRAGTVTTGELDYRATHCLDNWKNDECLACCYLPLCFGGCRYMKLQRDGGMHGIDCKKAYYDRTLPHFVSQDGLYPRDDD